jgi:hypothetical protein
LEALGSHLLVVEPNRVRFRHELRAPRRAAASRPSGPRHRHGRRSPTPHDDARRLDIGQSIRTSTDATDFTDVADRIGALGGQFSLSSNDGRTVVTAVLPCAS